MIRTDKNQTDLVWEPCRSLLLKKRTRGRGGGGAIFWICSLAPRKVAMNASPCPCHGDSAQRTGHLMTRPCLDGLLAAR